MNNKQEAIELLRPLVNVAAMISAAFLTALAFFGVFSALCVIR